MAYVAVIRRVDSWRTDGGKGCEFKCQERIVEKMISRVALLTWKGSKWRRANCTSWLLQ